MRTIISFFFLILTTNLSLSANEESIYDKIDLFGEVLDKINKEYVEEVNQSDAMDAAINGVLQSLDPYSAYMSPDMFKEMKTEKAVKMFKKMRQIIDKKLILNFQKILLILYFSERSVRIFNGSPRKKDILSSKLSLKAFRELCNHQEVASPGKVCSSVLTSSNIYMARYPASAAFANAGLSLTLRSCLIQ